MTHYETLRRIIKHPSYEFREDHLCTNTWKGRHELKLRRLEQTLFDLGMRDVTVFELGPGGVTEEYFASLPVFDEEDRERLKRFVKGMINPSETIARHRPDAKLTSSEPGEILNILSQRVGVKKLYVGDKFPQVLEGVRRLNLRKVETVPVNIDSDSEVILPEADVVISYHSLEYCPRDTQRALDRLSSFGAGKPKVLSLTMPRGVELSLPSYVQTSPNVYHNKIKPAALLPAPRPFLREVFGSVKGR